MSSTRLLLVGFFALGAVACTGPNPEARPIGWGMRGSAPTGLTARLADKAEPGAVKAAAACEGGDFSACNRLGWMFQSGTSALDSYAAFRIDARKKKNEAAAAGKDDHGGHGAAAPVPTEMPRDEAASRELAEFACRSGWTNTCTVAGGMMLSGVGGERDVVRGSRLIQEACVAGHDMACAVTGVLVTRMAFGQQGDELADQAFARACDRWILQACDAYNGPRHSAF